MALPDVARLIADRLDAIGAEWMATGSIAAMTYGEYRVTNDMDIMLTLTRTDISKLTAGFHLDEFYCPPADVDREVLGKDRGARTGRSVACRGADVARNETSPRLTT